MRRHAVIGKCLTLDVFDALRHGGDMPTNDAADELLTATQVGVMINRSSRTVIRLAESGDLPIATKLPGPNGAHLFKRGDVQDLVEKLAEKAASA